MAIFGRRVQQVIHGDATYYYVHMGSKTAAFLTWEPVTSTISVHFANRKFNSAGVGVGGANSTPPLRYNFPDAQDTDFRFSIYALDWVDASTEDSTDALQRKWAEQSWDAKLLGMYGDDL